MTYYSIVLYLIGRNELVWYNDTVVTSHRASPLHDNVVVTRQWHLTDGKWDRRPVSDNPSLLSVSLTVATSD